MQDWQAVGAAIAARLDEQGLTMTELAARSGVSLTTVRELVHVLSTRRRQPRTLAALSSALGWSDNHLGMVLRGKAPVGPPAPDDQPDLEARVRAVEERLSDIESRLPR
jgi:lambda repressor-like predicted transcriptional regulator